MRTKFTRVSVIGLGYIGLPTAATLASRGLDVVGVDVSEHAVNTINKGKVHIVEPELDVLVRASVMSGKLRAVLEPEPAEAFIIAVPTPFMDGMKPDLSYIFAALETIAPVLEQGNLVILESTSPVGTTEQMVHRLAELRPDLGISTSRGEPGGIHFAHCPERVLPGKVIRELVENDRIIGGYNPCCAAEALELYKIFVRGELVVTDDKTAEMSKLTENAFRDVNIAFANELSLICDELGINVWELIHLANRHPRVNILQPGPGVGGHCIAVDPWFIVDAAPEQARLIRASREINDGKPLWVLERIRSRAERFKNPTIACLGLAFKANIDDLRESPALKIATDLAADCPGELLLVEPFIDELPAALAGTGKAALVSLDEALARADVVAVLVDHDVFKTVHRDALQEKIVIDTRGIWN